MSWHSFLLLLYFFTLLCFTSSAAAVPPASLSTPVYAAEVADRLLWAFFFNHFLLWLPSGRDGEEHSCWQHSILGTLPFQGGIPSLEDSPAELD